MPDPIDPVRPPRISVVIPCYNSESTLPATISSCIGSGHRALELIVVDDMSTDRSAEIAERLGAKVLRLSQNAGAANARNVGAQQASGDILVFVDADVALAGDAISRIEADLMDGNISCVQALYSRHCPIENFASQYQNFYQFYNFDKIKARYIEIASTYCFAIRRKDFVPFNVDHRTAEDGEWGNRLFRQGKRILLDKKLTVEHLQQFTLRKILRRSFRISADKAWSVKHYRAQVATDLGKTHHSRMKIAAILLSPIPPLFWLLSGDFFYFIFKQKGAVFLLKTMAFHEVNYLASLTGLMAGTLRGESR